MSNSENSNKKVMKTVSSKAFKSSNVTFSPKELKDVQNLDTWQLKQEKGKIKNKIRESNNQLNQIKDDYSHYFEKTNNREKEIREHIANLDYVHSTNVDKIKQDIQSLYDDINQNITFIENKMKFEIEDKKKDIENRINIRLMDSEYSHRQLLAKKIKEQEGFMKVLHNFTSEIVKIQNNYTESKMQVTTLLATNNQLKDNINKVNLAKKKLLDEMKSIKSIIHDVRLEIFLAHENRKLDNEREGLSLRNSIEVKPNFMSYSTSQLPKPQTPTDIGKFPRVKSGHPRLNQPNPYSNFICKPSSASVNSSSVKLKPKFVGERIIKSSLQYRKITSSYNKVVERKSKVSKLLQNQQLLSSVYTKHPQIQEVVTHLRNILTSVQEKYRKMIRELNKVKIGDNHLREIVYGVTSNLKQEKATDEDNNDDLTEIYLSKDQRRRFIDKLTKNYDVLEKISNEKFPCITISHRELNYK